MANQMKQLSPPELEQMLKQSVAAAQSIPRQTVVPKDVSRETVTVTPRAVAQPSQTSEQPSGQPSGQFTKQQIGQRIRASNPQAFGGFSDEQIADRAIQRKPELGSLLAAPKAKEPNILQQIAQPLTDMAATGVRGIQGIGTFGKAVMQDPGGVAASFFQGKDLTGPAAETLATLGPKGEGVEKPVDLGPLGQGQVRRIGTVTEKGIVPSGETVKSLGTAAELASFAIPGAKIAKGTTILPRMAVRGAEGLLVGALSEGGRAARETGDLAQVPGRALKGAALGGAFGAGVGVLGRGADLAGDQITKARKALQPVVDKAVANIKGQFNSPALAARAVNSAIKPSKRAFSFSRNPGATVAKYRIIGDNIDDLAKNIRTTQSMVGSKIDDALTVPTAAAKRLDLTDTLGPIEKAIKKAVETGDDTAYGQLNKAKERILNIFVEKEGQLVPKGARKLVNVTPKQATELKRLVGEMVKWTERSTDEEIVNGALYGVYGNIQRKVEKAVPSIKGLNADYSGLLEAAKAATERSAVLQRQNMLGLDTGVKGLGGALIGLIASGGGAAPAIASGVTVAGVNNALKQPAVLTRFAAWLSRATPAETQRVFIKFPAIKIAIMNNAYLRNLLEKAALKIVE